MNKNLNLKKLIPLFVIIWLIAAAIIAVFEYSSAFRLPVLMYHNLCENEEDVNSETVSAAEFKKDMLQLKKDGYTALLPSELAEMSDEELKNGKYVMITFDDGYKSNYEIAYPILKEQGMKATIFVVSALVDNSAEDPNISNWAMLKEMSDSGIIEIGSHTHNLHNRDLHGAYNNNGPNGVQKKDGESNDEYKARLRSDFETACEKIKTNIGKEPAGFAYPFGANSKIADEIVSEYFKVSFLTGDKIARKAPGSCYLLNRLKVSPNHDSLPEYPW